MARSRRYASVSRHGWTTRQWLELNVVAAGKRALNRLRAPMANGGNLSKDRGRAERDVGQGRLLQIAVSGDAGAA